MRVLADFGKLGDGVFSNVEMPSPLLSNRCIVEPKEPKLTISMGVSSTWESHLKPLKAVKYEFTKVIDDLGAEISVVGYGSDPPGVGGLPGVMIFRVLGGGGAEDPTSFKFSLKGMTAGTKAIDKLIGTATYSFPLDYSPILFQAPRAGDVQELRDFKISIDNLKKKDCVFLSHKWTFM